MIYPFIDYNNKRVRFYLRRSTFLNDIHVATIEPLSPDHWGALLLHAASRFLDNDESRKAVRNYHDNNWGVREFLCDAQGYTSRLRMCIDHRHTRIAWRYMHSDFNGWGVANGAGWGNIDCAAGESLNEDYGFLVQLGPSGGVNYRGWQHRDSTSGGREYWFYRKEDAMDFFESESYKAYEG